MNAKTKVFNRFGQDNISNQQVDMFRDMRYLMRRPTIFKVQIARHKKLKDHCVYYEELK